MGLQNPVHRFDSGRRLSEKAPEMGLFLCGDVVCTQERSDVRLHSPDGDDLGEATYAPMLHPYEEIIAGDNQHLPRTRRCAVR
jgi:hypothetical protein